LTSETHPEGWGGVAVREVGTIKADPAELTTAGTKSIATPGNDLWQTIRGFILWSHERGTIQYDVMVTLILLFVFFSPRVIKFNDSPVERNPHATSVVVYPDEVGGLVFEVDAKAVHPGNDAAVRSQLLRVIEPISGESSITNYVAVTDKKGKVVSYKVWVSRQ
jgi:hypothetical protein